LGEATNGSGTGQWLLCDRFLFGQNYSLFFFFNISCFRN
jgi:hypothetical protein